MRIIFEASEAQYEPHELTGEAPISLDQPASVTVDLPGSWVQFTYEWLRSAPNGDHIAVYEDGFWRVVADLPVTRATMLNGEKVDTDYVNLVGMVFTDIMVL